MNDLYAGETWTAHRPGEEGSFNDCFVARDAFNDVMLVRLYEKTLKEAARKEKVRLIWKKQGLRVQAKQEEAVRVRV